MTEPLPDTWHSRDLPVLRTVVRLYDETMRVVRVQTVVEATGLSDDDVRRAGIALNAAGLVETGGTGQKKILMFGGITAEARRLTGSWPSADSIADRLLATLEHLAANGSDEVVQSKARKAADALGSFTRDTLVSVAGAAAGVAMQ